MPIKKFPDPTHATPEGIVAIGGDLHPDSLVLAYRSGIFPWPVSGLPLPWFCPPRRAILEFKHLHLPRSLAKAWRQVRNSEGKRNWSFTQNRDFEGVISRCATVPRPAPSGVTDEGAGTWITPEMLEAYVALHRRGYAHSFETWSGEKLIGGIYGVEVDGVFSAESMFYLEPYASKFALLALIEDLRARHQEWLDIQMLTPHMERLGAREIPRSVFLKKLKAAQERFALRS